MTDDIQALTSQLARDPSSLVFLPLAEALRRRGQLDSALTVAQQGAARYPEMVGAWDLVARIRADQGEGDLAFDAWTTVLRLDSEHVGAHKGLGFLYFRAGEHRWSLRHLERALLLDPQDAAVQMALEKVRELAGARPVPGYERPAPDPLAGLEREPGQAILVDLQGRLLAGELHRSDANDAAEEVAAILAGVTREAERAARLLGLGPWTRIALEGGAAHFELRAPGAEAVLLLTRSREVPPGRLALLADRAAAAARRWLEELR